MTLVVGQNPGKDVFAVLDGLVFRGGSAVSSEGEGDDIGGAIVVFGEGEHDDTSVRIVDCTFVGNQAKKRGGAIGASRTGADVSDSVFRWNRVLGSFSFGEIAGGGAIGITGPLRLVRSTLVGNQALFTSGGVATDTCSGGAVLAEVAVVANCRFRGNAAARGNGGGLSCSGTVMNCVFSGNESNGVVTEGVLVGGRGGGMAVVGADITLCTFFANHAFAEGGGANWSEGTMWNCILWGNSTDPPYEGQVPPPLPFHAQVFPEPTGDSCVQDWECTVGIGCPTNFASDPRFLDPVGPDGLAGTEDDNLQVWPLSPCVDRGDDDAAGVPGDLGDVDEDGNTSETLPWDVVAADRTVDLEPGGGIVDVGAYERTDCIANVDCSGDLNFDGTVDGADLGTLLVHWDTMDGDLSGDCTTDGADLGLLLVAWGPCPGGDLLGFGGESSSAVDAGGSALGEIAALLGFKDVFDLGQWLASLDPEILEGIVTMWFEDP